MSAPDSPSSLPPSIGVFDSGVGGLTVLRELRRELPDVSLRYVADAAHAPYGGRSPAYIAERSLAIAEHLIAHGARLLVYACNTGTVHAIAALRARWPALPIVGTEPGIKPAVAASLGRGAGRVGVLATAATIASPRLAALIESHGQGAEIVRQPCPGLVDLIEAGDLSAPALRRLVAEFCAPLRAEGVDTVLLACTHYPLVQPLFQAEFGPTVQIVNIERAVAQQAARLWTALDPASTKPGLPTIELASTGDPAVLTDFVRRALGWPGLSAEALLSSPDADAPARTARTAPAASGG